MKYYTNSGDEVLKELNSSLNGLTNGEATNRLNKYGYNELEQKKKKTLLKMIVLQLKDAMIIILFIAALISFLLNETAEAIVILVIIFIRNMYILFF